MTQTIAEANKRLVVEAFDTLFNTRATIENQSWYLRSVGASLVTGVYTYVRDGVVTTAGLKGSRTAELIEQIGAVDQTRDDVTRRRFVQGPDR
jgi:hypothetical protein